MKYPRPPLIIFALIGAALCLASCGTDPAAIARQQKAAAIGNKLLDLGVKRGIISATEAQDFRELGEIILEAPAELKPAIPAPDAAAEKPETSGKNPPKVPVYPVGYRRPVSGYHGPQYCAAMPRAPPMARAGLS